MGSNGSFYSGGLAYGTEDNGLGRIPAGVTPSLAPSSFYQSGTAYAALANTDALTSLFNSSVSAVALSASQASASAAAAAASAAAAAGSVAGALLKANNLSDLSSVATAKANLSLVKGDVGLGSVDNTSDASKPISTAQATVNTAQATTNGLKAPLASPALTGVPTAPTATVGTNTVQLATTAFVAAAVTASTTGVASVDAKTGAFTTSNGVKTVVNDFQLNVSGLTTDAAPDGVNDFVLSYDASASAHKKVALGNTYGKGFFLVDRNNIDQTGVSTSAYNRINFNHKVVDTMGWFDAATNFRFQPLEAGYYFFELLASTDAGTSTGGQPAIFKNGTNAAQGLFLATTQAIISHIGVTLFMNGSTDYVEAMSWVSSGSTLIAGALNKLHFSGWKVSN